MHESSAAELLFESFCAANGVRCNRVKAGATPTPDYRLSVGDHAVYVEVKQIDVDPDFRATNGVSSRQVGEHVRRKIADARGQMQVAAASGHAAILLIYNNLDPLQLFGTEQHDFLCAMYGELTISLRAGNAAGSYYGRNSTLRSGHNASFSAVGHLYRRREGLAVRLYENFFAKFPLEYGRLPDCIETIRISLDNAA